MLENTPLLRQSKSKAGKEREIVGAVLVREPKENKRGGHS